MRRGRAWALLPPGRAPPRALRSSPAPSPPAPQRKPSPVPTSPSPSVLSGYSCGRFSFACPHPVPKHTHTHTHTHTHARTEPHSSPCIPGAKTSRSRCSRAPGRSGLARRPLAHLIQAVDFLRGIHDFSAAGALGVHRRGSQGRRLCGSGWGLRGAAVTSPGEPRTASGQAGGLRAAGRRRPDRRTHARTDGRTDGGRRARTARAGAPRPAREGWGRAQVR